MNIEGIGRQVGYIFRPLGCNGYVYRRDTTCSAVHARQSNCDVRRASHVGLPSSNEIQNPHPRPFLKISPASHQVPWYPVLPLQALHSFHIRSNSLTKHHPEKVNHFAIDEQILRQEKMAFNMENLRFSDEDPNGIETINMQDVEDFESDYYENNTGDTISGATKHRRARKKNYFALGLLAVGTVMVVGGVGYAFLGMGKESQASFQSGSPTPKPEEILPAEVDVPGVPTAQETSSPETPTAQETSSPETASPSQASLSGLLSKFVSPGALDDPKSLAHVAMKWLEGNFGLEGFSKERLVQRFALACIYFATNSDSTWMDETGWMTDDDECGWYGVQCKELEVISLNLTSNGLEGLIPSEITLLSETLISLELARNDLVNEGKELAWIGELTKLRLLDVEGTLFSHDGIPPYIGLLPKLQILDIAETLFVGEIDGSIFEPLTELLFLEMGGNMFNSTMPLEIINLSNLEALYAYSTGLEGQADFIPLLSDSLFELWLDDNPNLGGTIPPQIGRMTNLASFSVTGCDFWGQIPTEIGRLTLMEQMWFFGNRFSGTIPSEIANLPKLQILGLEDNNITQVSMPQEICALDLLALSADCGGESDLIACDCCTCCEAPCPIVNLPMYEQRRMAEVVDEIRRG